MEYATIPGMVIVTNHNYESLPHKRETYSGASLTVASMILNDLAAGQTDERITQYAASFRAAALSGETVEIFGFVFTVARMPAAHSWTQNS